MAQTVANLTDVLKEAWTSERIQKQFFDQDELLKRIGTVDATMIGEKAIVPIHKGRSGGYTSTNAAGGTLNDADEQKVDSAEYTLVYHWFQVQLETGALNQASGSTMQALVGAKDLEMQGAIDDVRNQCTRQLVSDGTGRIAQCTTTTTSNTILLDPTGLGYDAIVRGYLYPGLLVDIGTTADSDVIATGVEITAITESSTAPSITVSGSTVSTTSSHYISIANPNSATATSPELNGLRNIVSTTESLGGLDPQTAGEEFWTAAEVNTTDTTLSLSLALDLQRKVFQKTGRNRDTEVWTSLLQQQRFYEILQNQERFSGDVNIGVGDSDKAKWRGMAPNAIPEIYDRDWFVLSMKDLVRIQGSIKKPTWATDLGGQGGGLIWTPGQTNFKNGVVWPWNVGAQRRLGFAGATNLTA